MELLKHIIIAVFLSFLLGCSTELADIENKNWKCDNTNKIQNLCSVSFSISNKSHFPIKSTIRIRAHNRKSVMGSDAVQNIVVGDKVLEVDLQPDQTLEISQELEAKGRVTNIVVTTTNNEQ